MEKTLENRLKLYSTYLGSDIIIDSDCFQSEGKNEIIKTKLVSIHLRGSIECDGWIPEITHTYLELKPLSSITDEELVKIAQFYEPTAHNVKLENDQIEFDFIYGDKGASGAIEISDGYCLDWLRSNGFVTEWMGLSVETMIEFGWIKLKEN